MKIKYFMSHGSPWTFLGHKKVNEISKKNNCELDIMPVNYGEIFPVSGGLPVHKRPLQRQKYRLQELKRWSEFLKIKLNPEPKNFPSRSLLPSKVIISVKILNFENVNDIAYAIMEGLWIKEMNSLGRYNLWANASSGTFVAGDAVDIESGRAVHAPDGADGTFIAMGDRTRVGDINEGQVTAHPNVVVVTEDPVDPVEGE